MRNEACRITSAAVRYGVGALLALFYFDAFLRGGDVLDWLVFGVLLVPATVGLIVTTHELPRASAPRLRDITLATAGALAVTGLVRAAGLPPVLAASLVGVAAALAAMLPRVPASAAAILYCGAFAGMTSELVLVGWHAVLLAGVIGGLLASLLSTTWEGVGGKLGLMAFAGVFLTTLVARALDRIGDGASLVDFDRDDKLALILVPPLAAAITWALRSRGLSAVMASAAPTAAFAALVTVTHGTVLPGDHLPFEATPLCIAWFGGSFVGMTGTAHVRGRIWPLVAAGGLFGALQIGFEPTLAGIGGDFGATAAVSVLVTLGALRLFGRTSPSPA